MIHYPVRVYYVGRLDKDSEGLVLMTNEGDLVNKVMRSGNAHEKEYRVTVDRPVTEDFLNRMRKGIYLKDLDRPPFPARRQRWRTGNPCDSGSGTEPPDSPDVRCLRLSGAPSGADEGDEHPAGRPEKRRIPPD